MAFRYDAGELQKPVKQPNGWVRADGFITRTGVFKYRRADGSTVLEYRPPEEVFHPDSLASFEVVPLTNGHPPEGILTAENTQKYQRGTVIAPRADGHLMRAQFLITDADTIEAAKNGKNQLSGGYVCDIEDAPGVSPDGERYDAVQRNIRGNHVALVDTGRAGPAVRLRFDGAAIVLHDDTCPIQKGSATADTEISMIKFKVDGIDHEMSETAAQAVLKALSERDAQITAVKADGVKLQKALDEEKARADKADADLAKAREDLKEAPAKAAAAMKARADLEKQAEKVIGEMKFDGLSDRQVKEAVIKAEMPKAKLDGKSEDYVAGLFDRIVADAADDAEEAEESEDEVEVPRGDSNDVLATAQRKYQEALAKISPK
jgi:hypothetical protein